jgi:hypothetical protein
MAIMHNVEPDALAKIDAVRGPPISRRTRQQPERIARQLQSHGLAAELELE